MKVLPGKRSVFTFLLTALVYLTGAALFAIYSNHQSQKKMIDELDHRLLMAAKSLKYMLATDFHDRAVAPDAVSLEEELINREKISRFTAETRFAYVYTLVRKDGQFYFSAPTVTKAEQHRQERWYFHPYEDAPPEFHEALEQMAAEYVTYTDQWGTFRSVALPQTSPDGNRYLACADYDISYLRFLFWQDFTRSLLTVTPLLLLTVPFLFIFRAQERNHSERLEKINLELSERADELMASKYRLEQEMAGRLATREALRASEKRLRNIFDMVQAGIVIIDPETHTVVDANPAAIRIMESERENIVGNICHKTICPAEKGRCPITDLGQKVDNSERVVLTPDGREKPVIKTVSTIHLDGRSHLLGSFIDISPLKEAEVEKEKLQNQLYQSQKMEAIGTLAGGIAHDFNNLLSIILGYTEMLLDDVPPGHENENLLQEIHKAAGRARDVTRQLLAFSRKQVLAVRNIDVNRTILGFQKMLHRFIGEDIRLDLRLMNEPAVVTADISQMEQVLMNLVINGRDAMPHGGLLRIETGPAELDEEYARQKPDVVPGAYIMIAVSDTGTGIEKRHIKNIFEPFYTTKEQGKGTGLGLATVFGIVKQHGGHIVVCSEPGHGTTFRIYLPCASATQPDQSLPEPSPADVRSERCTILIAEDDVSVRRFICQVLQQQGHRVLESADAANAVEIAERTGDKIDILLTDVIMPVLNGPEVFRQVSASHPETKALYTSGYTDSMITRHGVYSGDTFFLQKPFSGKQLNDIICRILNCSGETSGPETTVPHPVHRCPLHGRIKGIDR